MVFSNLVQSGPCNNANFVILIAFVAINIVMNLLLNIMIFILMWQTFLLRFGMIGLLLKDFKWTILLGLLTFGKNLIKSNYMWIASIQIDKARLLGLG